MAHMFIPDITNPRYQAYIVWDDARDGWRDTKIGGTPLKPELAPTSGYIEKKKIIPEFMCPEACWVVSQAVKDIVEGLEPGVHQFLPVRLRNGKRGEPIETPYYIMRILQVIEAVDVERSPSLSYSPVRGKQPPARMGMYFSSDPPQIVADPAKIADAHLWIDPWIDSHWFMSDAVHDALKRIKAKGLTIVTRLHDHYGRLN